MADSHPTPDSFWATVDSSGCWPFLGKIARNGYGKLGRQYAHRIAYEKANGPIPAGMVVRHKCDNRRCCNPEHLIVGTQKDNVHDAIARGRVLTGARWLEAMRGRLPRGDQHWSRRMPWRVSRGPKHGAAIAANARRGDENPARKNPELLREACRRKLARMTPEERADCFRRDVRGEKNPRAKLTTLQVQEIRAARINGERICEIAKRLGLKQTHVQGIIQRKTWRSIA